MMVQGFDAADPARASAREIIDEWSGEPGARSRARWAGTGRLLEFLARETPVQLQTGVREVRWKRCSVELRGTFRGEPWSAGRRARSLPCRSAVLPSLVREKTRPALEKLESGPVVRVAMAFRDPFWEKAHPGVAFFHSPDAPFPTFWTPLPMHAPLLTCWAGGPRLLA